jgi:hypothetical protein
MINKRLIQQLYNDGFGAVAELIQIQADKIAELKAFNQEQGQLMSAMTEYYEVDNGVTFHSYGLEQQAMGRLDGVAYALNMYCTTMSPKEFPPIGKYYADQLKGKALKEQQ